MAIIINIDVMLAKRKMSVTELSERVGITMANLSILKNGKAKAIRLSTLEAICKALECQPGDILEYKSDEDNQESRNIIDVNEYDYFIDSLSLIEGSTEFEGISVSYNSNNKELRILENDTVLFDGNLKTYANRILNEYDNQEGKYDTLLNQEDAIFVDENSNVKMKLIITSLSGEKSGVYNENLIEHMEFYMFIKIK